MHISVLLEEAINALNLQETSFIVDATLGYAGHSSEILKRIKRGFLFAFDQDVDAINYSKNYLSTVGSNYEIIKSNFCKMKEELNKREIFFVNGILFDLGVSSPQLDEKERGFSYHQDAPLDMRMDKDNPLTAYIIVNTYDEAKLTDIFYRFGEDKYAKSIARKIVKERSIKPIATTLSLVEIIKAAVPIKDRLLKHPAKQIFQALRIEVNHELDILEQSIEDALSLLEIKGRLVIITFHSLEDKKVKDVFKKYTSIPSVVKGLPNIPLEYLPNYKLINNKVILPSKEELEINNRSHSAKLRVIERIK